MALHPQTPMVALLKANTAPHSLATVLPPHIINSRHQVNTAPLLRGTMAHPLPSKDSMARPHQANMEHLHPRDSMEHPNRVAMEAHQLSPLSVMATRLPTLT